MIRNPLKNNIMFESKAFTLVELMVVIGIIAIMSAIAIPNLLNPEHKLKKAATGLFADMQRTRSMAIKTNKEWAIVFDTSTVFSPDHNRYFITSDRTDLGDDGDLYTIDDTQPVEKIVEFSGYAAGVRYGRHSAGAATKNATRSGGGLPSDGSSYGSGNILVFNPKGMVNTVVSGIGEKFVYLEYKVGTSDPAPTAYAVGTESTGIVKILSWVGGAWK